MNKLKPLWNRSRLRKSRAASHSLKIAIGLVLTALGVWGLLKVRSGSTGNDHESKSSGSASISVSDRETSNSVSADPEPEFERDQRARPGIPADSGLGMKQFLPEGWKLEGDVQGKRSAEGNVVLRGPDGEMIRFEKAEVESDGAIRFTSKDFEMRADKEDMKKVANMVIKLLKTWESNGYIEHEDMIKEDQHG